MFCCLGSIKINEIVLTTIEANQYNCIGCSEFFVAASETLFGDHLRCAHTLTAHQIHDKLLSNNSDAGLFVNWICAQQQQQTRVIKLSKSARFTSKYGVTLLKDEALQANCNRIGICTVTKDNHQITVRCWSTQCKHSHRLLVSQEAEMCPHAKLTLAYIRESDVDVLVDDGPDSDHNDMKRSKTAGVWFNSSRNCWWPDEKCGQVQIPYEPNDEAKRWFLRRLTMDDIKRSPNRSPTMDVRGCFEGDPCIAPQCSVCNAKFADMAGEVDAEDLDISIVIHTLSGPIARKKFCWVCTCGQRNHWDPSSEFIHTIRSGAEGGMCILRVHAHFSTFCVYMQYMYSFACERMSLFLEYLAIARMQAQNLHVHAFQVATNSFIDFLVMLSEKRVCFLGYQCIWATLTTTCATSPIRIRFMQASLRTTGEHFFRVESLCG